MKWEQVRSLHPNQWVLIEALDAHSEGDHRRLDRIAVVDVCADGAAVQRRYQELHRAHPERELYFAHTGNADLDIEERPWVGIRMGHAPHAAE